LIKRSRLKTCCYLPDDVMKITHMFRLLLTLFAIIFSMGVRSFAEIIPADRKIDWTPGIVSGVPGGIPNRTTIGKNVVTDYGADPTGATSSDAAFISARDNCSNGQVIKIPAGTYKITTQLNLTRSNVTWRGDGMGRTIIKNYNSNPIYIGNGDWLPGPNDTPTITIAAGAIKGSTQVTVDSTANITVGKLITISQTNPSFVHYSSVYGSGPTDDGHDKNRLMAFTVKVTAKTSSTVTIEHPFPADMPNSPMITWWNYLVSGTGFEAMTFDMSAGTSIAALQFIQVYGCWVKNVEVSQAFSRQFWFVEAVNCEIRRCYTHDNRGGGPNHEGIDFTQNGCWNLIEDNICVRGGSPFLVLGDWGGGCAGNVIAYNYTEDQVSGNSYAGMAICDSHGGHNMFNLYEGNVTQNIAADGYYGSTSTGTIFRNVITGYYTPVTSVLNQVPIALMLNRWSTSYNVVGNVLGKTGNINNAVYDQTTNGYSALISSVLRLGYPNYNTSYGSSASNPESGSTNIHDTNVRATLILHGNYDFVRNLITWNGGGTPPVDPSDHNIPASMCRSARPAWWPPTVAWPPIGPDRTPMVNEIPAQIRFRTFAAPSPNPPRNLRVVP
jgi:hypothetical protein